MTSPSFSRVMLIDCVTQAALHNVCVNLCGAEIGVAQHQLYASQVGAAFEQVGGEGVAQDVRTQRLINAGGFSMDAQQLPEALACHTFTSRGHEQKWAWPSLEKHRTFLAAIGAYGGEGLPANGHEPLLVPLSDDP